MSFCDGHLASTGVTRAGGGRGLGAELLVAGSSVDLRSGVSGGVARAGVAGSRSGVALGRGGVGLGGRGIASAGGVRVAWGGGIAGSGGIAGGRGITGGGGVTGGRGIAGSGSIAGGRGITSRSRGITSRSRCRSSGGRGSLGALLSHENQDDIENANLAILLVMDGVAGRLARLGEGRDHQGDGSAGNESVRGDVLIKDFNVDLSGLTSKADVELLLPRRFLASTILGSSLEVQGTNLNLAVRVLLAQGLDIDLEFCIDDLELKSTLSKDRSEGYRARL